MAASADEIVKITQVDATAFPEVALYVSVTDERGLPMAGLTREDFRLIEDGKPVEIKDFAGIDASRPVDIVFVFDTTGSMSDEIAGVKNTCVAFADKLRRANRDFRLGLITFGDEIREVYGANNMLTDDAEEFKRWIGRQRADGGDDTPEISLDGLARATQMRYRSGIQNIMILITDAPPHVRGDGTSFSRIDAETLTTQLRDNGYTVYAVAYNDARFRRLVEETHGEFYDLRRSSDFTGIIDKIGGQIASQYRMTYISARPFYDGTRRAVEVEVAGRRAGGKYLEKHLINVRSSPVIAVLFLLPLLVALALPSLARRRAAHQPVPMVEASGPAEMRADSGEHLGQPVAAGAASSSTVESPTAGQTLCPKCGSALRPSAKFCGRCGHVLAGPAAAPTPLPIYCPNCGRPQRPGAKFCGACGHKVS